MLNAELKHKEILHKPFYLSEDVVDISRQLLGKVIETSFYHHITAGIIVETEAYASKNDQASHSSIGKTRRNSTMFKAGGIAYIYLCYGIHSLFNVVVSNANNPQAVLIRAIQPISGIKYMLQRRKMQKISYHITSGPGKVSQALSIKLNHNGYNLQDSKIKIYDTKEPVLKHNIISSPRIGVSYAGQDALKPWRFRIKGNPWCGP